MPTKRTHDAVLRASYEYLERREQTPADLRQKWRFRKQRWETCGAGLDKPQAIVCKDLTHCGFASSVTVYRCNQRNCAECWPRRSRDLRDRIHSRLALMKRPRFLTLTFQNVPKGQLREYDRYRLNRALAQFMKDAQRNGIVSGAIAVIEVTNKGTGGWNLHVHVVWDGRFWPQRQLASHWVSVCERNGLEANPAAQFVKSVDSAEGCARYLSSYLAKQVDWSGWRTVDAAEFMDYQDGTRVLRCYGDARAKAPGEDDKSVCPECGGGLRMLSGGDFETWCAIGLIDLEEAHVKAEQLGWEAGHPERTIPAFCDPPPF